MSSSSFCDKKNVDVKRNGSGSGRGNGGKLFYPLTLVPFFLWTTDDCHRRRIIHAHFMCRCDERDDDDDFCVLFLVIHSEHHSSFSLMPITVP